MPREEIKRRPIIGGEFTRRHAGVTLHDAIAFALFHSASGWRKAVVMDLRESVHQIHQCKDVFGKRFYEYFLGKYPDAG